MLRTNVSALGQCGRNVRWPWALDERTLLSLLWDRETDRQRDTGATLHAFRYVRSFVSR